MMSDLEAAKVRVSATVGAGVAAAREKLALAVLQYGFLRANWGKLSAIVVTAMVIAFALGAWVF
jgi:hypothetical protein